ncbi:sulfurtransferase TusA family protein [Synechocystis sp. PCC 7339]|uniref:sulfurtransferase TusA family protein n=1 Tax=Synechocystis TaxID=1142 RepID=UPI0018810085|nr:MULTISPECIES: sulfurtransferase TusA family protein [Synechocystis]MBE9203714.1 sulfurtransferase TusA family protein [Synechocystis salina LEGE 06099]QUS62203.1 sulfurtransferase TusA family protein [Synechocystis sp. PCC 7338]UAJ71387.1 sulfurtransferase TusA family protein [Synechocystis sp. PCC 7339]
MSQGNEPILLDLRGTPCPINFVRTKLKLAQMAPGQCLEVWLDGGEPVEQVPHSLELEGYTEQSLRPLEGESSYCLTITVPVAVP